MAFTKAQLEALKNSLLASNQPITAAIHRAFAQKLIDELYDAQSRGNLLAGVQDSGATVAGDEILVIRSGVAYLVPASLFGSGISFDDLNGIVIVDPQDGDLLSYNALTDSWQNLPNTFVPYDGATASVNLGEFGLRAGFVRFDTSPTGTPTDQGTMFWDADNETVDVVLNGYTMKIGEDLFYPVKNQTGATIPKGTAVRFNGTVGASGRLLIAPFLADGSLPSSRFMGVTAEAIADGEDGKVLWFGRLRGINTNAFNEGDILYASTTVAGGYQTTLPAPPNNVISVAAVINKSVNQGVLFVRPQIETAGDFVTIATAQNITGAKVFLNQLLALIGSNPVFRVTTTDNEATVNFRNAANEDAAGVVMSTPLNEVALVTRVGNKNIRIQPHGSGKILLPNLPAGFGGLLARDTNNNIVVDAIVYPASGESSLLLQADFNGISARSAYVKSTPTVALTDQGGGATYSFTTSTYDILQSIGFSLVQIELTNINTTGTPTGELRLDLGNVGVRDNFGVWDLQAFRGSSIASPGVLRIRQNSARYLYFRDIDGASNRTAVTFTGGSIRLTGYFARSLNPSV